MSDGAVSATAADCWHLEHIGRWNRAVAGEGIVVGVADSWLHPVEPALARAVPDVRAFAADGSEAAAVPLPSSHGTSVASLIAASAHGVAPRASIVFASVLRQADGQRRFEATPEQAAAGLRWLARASVEGRRVRLINVSFTVSHSTALYEAVTACLEAGIVIVAATGNDQATVGYPAAYPGVVSVGALDRSDRLAAASGRSATAPDVWAPGMAVRTLGALGPRWVGGTSMAAAVVTGGIAAMMSARNGLHAGTIHAHLARTARRHASGAHCLRIA
ncbi:MAG: S8 family serine peptidase [Acidobacteria bacterium]|nr:S8 family serine peptidase [Acidobacteriota bacterium]